MVYKGAPGNGVLSCVLIWVGVFIIYLSGFVLARDVVLLGKEKKNTLYFLWNANMCLSRNYVLGLGHSFSSIICDDNCFSFLTDLWCQIYQLELEILWSIAVQRLEVKKKCRCWFHKFPLAPFLPPARKTWIAEDFF